MLRASRCADDAEHAKDRAKRYLSFANWIAPDDVPVRAPRLRVYFLAATVAILAAFIIWDASASVDFPTRPQSNRAGAAW